MPSTDERKEIETYGCHFHNLLYRDELIMMRTHIATVTHIASIEYIVLSSMVITSTS